MSADMTIDDVERLLGLMMKHSVVIIDFRGLKVQRIPDTTPARSEAKQTELERLQAMPPDSIDAALMLRRHKGGVG
jgi:hypothetical protein